MKKVTKKSSSKSSKQLSRSKKWLLRFSGVLGYDAVFVPWVSAFGIGALVLVAQFFDTRSVQDASIVGGTTAQGTDASTSLLLLIILLMGVLMWVYMAYLSWWSFEWVVARVHKFQKYQFELRLGLLTVGWLVLLAILMFVAPEFDISWYFLTATGLTVGLCSFSLERLLLKRWKTTYSNIWKLR